MRQSINYFLGMLALFVLFAACTRNRPIGDVTSTGAESSATVVAAAATATAEAIGVEPASAPQANNRSTTDSSTAQQAQSSEPQTNAPTATPVPSNNSQSAQTGSSTFQYTVEPGDTLFSIGDKYGTDVGTIQQLNFLFDETIRAGQVLRLPLLDGYTAEGRPTPTPIPFRYPIQSGDTLSGIAAKFGVSTAELVSANGIVDTDSLYVGQEIIIPGRSSSAAAVDSSNTSVNNSSSSNSVTNQAIHIVSPGEGLLQIAERYNVSASDIATANNIQNRELLRTGQRLFIPGVSANQAAAINSTVHTVTAGQGLLQIAVRYNVDVDAIIEANGIQNTELIYPGQQLIIPSP